MGKTIALKEYTSSNGKQREILEWLRDCPLDIESFTKSSVLPTLTIVLSTKELDEWKAG